MAKPSHSSSFLQEGGDGEMGAEGPQQLSRNAELPPTVSDVLPGKTDEKLMDGMQLSS